MKVFYQQKSAEQIVHDAVDWQQLNKSVSMTI